MGNPAMAKLLLLLLIIVYHCHTAYIQFFSFHGFTVHFDI
jgi:hypothetical protein